jgi:histidine kinase
MNLLDRIRRRLGAKLFFSYLIIILVGVLSLMLGAQLSAPAALQRHAARMEATIAMVDGDEALLQDLNESFVTAVNEILIVAALAALVTAVAISTFVTRRVVGPIQRIQAASRRIAAGDYDERVEVPGEDEMGALAQSFNQMAQTLAETEERRRRLIGDMAHELRTPLSNIRSVMEGLVDGVLPTQPSTFHQVEREVTRLQRLVQDLEELSRAEAGQMLLERETVDPASFIEEAATRLRSQYRDKEVELAIHLPDLLPVVSADKWRMTQVMLNLLGNALQYTPQGGQVTVTAQPDQDRIVVRVADTGIGIAPEHLPHLFERFYRVDRSRSRAGGGSGIGLTISRYLVEAHGGQLWAKSAGPGQGSTFTFTLPTIG